MADRASGKSGIPGTGNEVLELVVQYAKQETLGPLKGVGRFVVFGIVGSVFLALGLSVLLLAGLRALQTETGTTFAGTRSWMPYLATAAAAVVVAALAGWRIGKGQAARRKERT
ncbi:MAG TPA: hypothetical protein VE991_08075 [Acidimicrobiales bacterium]|nr:hypothetical protein [Acidimicrobiales bacterium]